MNFRLVIVLSLLCIISPAKAEDLSVFTDEWAPYNFQENGLITGISTDIVKKTLQSAGFNYSIKILPWKRGLATTQRTPLSLMYTVARTNEREDLFKWVGPILNGRVYLYKLKKRTDISINSAEDIQRYKSAVLRGGAVQSYLQELGISPDHYVQVSYSDQLIPMLYANRVELIPGDELDLMYQIKQMDFKISNIETAFLLYQRDYYLALNKDTPDDIVNRLQLALDKLINTGERDQIIRNYMATE